MDIKQRTKANDYVAASEDRKYAEMIMAGRMLQAIKEYMDVTLSSDKSVHAIENSIW